MKKRFLAFLTVVVVTFFLIVIAPVSYSQDKTNSEEQAKPVVSAEDNKNQVNEIDGYPIILNDNTLFMVQTPSGSFSPQERAEAINKRLLKIAQDDSIKLNDIHLEKDENKIEIIASNKIIMTVTDLDAKSARQSREDLAENYLQKIKEAITQYRKEQTTSYKILGFVYTAIATLSILLILSVINFIFPYICNLIESSRGRYIPSVRIQNLELVTADRMADFLLRVFQAIRVILVLFILYLYIPFILGFFTITRPLSRKLFDYVFNALGFIFRSFANYLPNVFVIFLIAVTTYYIIRFSQFIFAEIGRGNISFPGFYPDWAEPTSNIVQFLIIALAFVVVFPYLPGFDSPAFRGISVFLGVLFSLGSTSAVANTVGGVILIYTRAFQRGDLVKIGDIIGVIEEKTLLVTRIRTPKNMLVTFPNSTVLNSNIINYTASSRETKVPLIIFTTITLGYDNPWRKVHETLIEAAKATQFILDDPAPFVLQTALNDFYVSYEINAYTHETRKMPEIYSALHQNIQDKCNEVGIEIMSPHYSTLRDGNQSTIPENYLPPDYTAPGFRVDSNNSK